MNLETITEYTDGTCRDINFDEQISQNGLLALLEFMNKEWEFKSGYNFGKSFSLEQILIEPPDQFYIDWCNGDNISDIRLFSVKEKTNEFYIELTFFPRDVKKPNLTVNKIVELCTKLQNSCQSKTFFLRYENASWRHGNLNDSVILSHLDLIKYYS